MKVLTLCATGYVGMYVGKAPSASNERRGAGPPSTRSASVDRALCARTAAASVRA